MGLLDKNVLALPRARSVLTMLAITGVFDALCIIVQGVALGTALSLAWEGAGIAMSADSQLWANIALWSAVFFAGYAGRQAISYVRARVMNRFARNRSDELQAQLVECTFAGGPAFVQAFGTGNVTTATIEGIDRVESYLEIILPKVADLIAIPVVLSIGLFVLDWVSGVIALAMLPCIALYMKMLGRNAREAAARQHGAYVRLGNHFIDTVRGIRTLAFFGRNRMAAREVYEVSERARAASMKAIQVATLSSLLLDLFRTFALAAVAIMLGFRLMDGSISLLPALAVLIIVPEYFAAIRRFSTDFHASLDGKNQLAAILEMIAWQEERASCAEREQVASLAGDLAQPTDSTALPVLSCSNVSYAYFTSDAPRGTTAMVDSMHYALSSVSFSTKGARRIGIVGVSGSGKSTLARLVAGFAQASAGAIEVNGIPADLCAQAWRSQVAYIPQNPHIFHSSVRDNIAFYQPDASRESIDAAIHAAGLDDVVDALPQGLDTLIGEGGRALSGGQAQRIALARAFLDSNRRVLVFDEPTAHLDLETEFVLKETMLPLMEDRLVFFATHRLHWMHDMDLLLVLEEGRIVEQGTYDDLVARNGAFTRLAARLSGKAAANEDAIKSESPATDLSEEDSIATDSPKAVADANSPEADSMEKEGSR